MLTIFPCVKKKKKNSTEYWSVHTWEETIKECGENYWANSRNQPLVLMKCQEYHLLTTTILENLINHGASSRTFRRFCLRSVQFNGSVVSDSLQHYESQHASPPCPSSTPGFYPNSCPLSRWFYPTISSSVIPFSSCPQPFSASGSFQMSQLLPQ